MRWEDASLSTAVLTRAISGSAEVNAREFGFDPASVDVLLLTHAHLDHCGRIPLLVKRGFKGEIIATAATRELARLVLLDVGASAGGRGQAPGAERGAPRRERRRKRAALRHSRRARPPSIVSAGSRSMTSRSSWRPASGLRSSMPAIFWAPPALFSTSPRTISAAGSSFPATSARQAVRCSATPSLPRTPTSW